MSCRTTAEEVKLRYTEKRNREIHWATADFVICFISACGIMHSCRSFTFSTFESLFWMWIFVFSVCDLFISNNKPITLHFSLHSLCFVLILFTSFYHIAQYSAGISCMCSSFRSIQNESFTNSLMESKICDHKYLLLFFYLNMHVLLSFFCHGLVTSPTRMTHWHTFIASQFRVYFYRYFRMLNQWVWLTLTRTAPIFSV